MADPHQRLEPAGPAGIADHDACGVGFVADVAGRASHEWLARGLDALRRLTHRGAPGDGQGSADGAGVLTAIPWDLLVRDLPAAFSETRGRRMAGLCFLPPAAAREAQAVIERALAEEGWRDTAWRRVPTDRACLGTAEAATEPAVYQVAALQAAARDGAALEAGLYRARLRAEASLAAQGLHDAAIVSLSRRTMTYKALVAPAALARYYPDLDDEAFRTAFVVFHQRFSTNTFPQWRLAQPFRVLAHNGEINTVLGNRRRMARRQADHASCPDLPADIGPLVRTSGSDSESLDDAVDLLRQAGFTLAHAVARLVPRAWAHDPDLSDEERAFERYQACFSEPWEGPGAFAFADGRQVGAALDRNGFRPLRVLVTEGGQICAASEAGVYDADESDIVQRGRLGPGEMLVVDLARGRLLDDRRIRRRLARQRQYRAHVDTAIADLPPTGAEPAPIDADRLRRLQRAFGYTAEEIEIILRPMVEEGREAVGSMGDDTPIPALTTRGRPLSDHFRQRFAQVTNPPIDALRESAVMSLESCFGREGRLLAEEPVEARLVRAPSPILTSAQRDALLGLPDRPAVVIATTYPARGGAAAFRAALARVTDETVAAVRGGAVAVVLSDRAVSAALAALPALLAVAAAYEALGAAGLGARAGLVADTGEVRDPHQAAVLLAFGAAALCPWLALDTARALAGRTGVAPEAAAARWRHAIEQGLLKILSKMGVCTIAGYCGGQLFEAVGLAPELVDRFFPGTPCVPGDVTLDRLAAQVAAAHDAAWAPSLPHLPHPGFHVFRRDGDHHAYNPALVRAFHRALAEGDDDAAYRRFTALVDAAPPTSVRDLLRFRRAVPIPLEAVEPVDRICRRFFASAMSIGALGPEAHETLARALNRLGGRSNSGEGGEDPARFARPAAGDWGNSATKQVASARFGVTPHYLISATELQIKMAQGSKPGEGGQLPATKVVDHIAALRFAPPHTALVSPPPHHDIYSIEDLAQLIYDLRSFHPTARLSVKLVATTGIGVIAAGVVKAGADVIQISGHDGGTGASPRGSIKHAGLPWEIGLADAHRVLAARGLRHRVILQTDGGLKTGRDVAVAAALGADEYGFGTALLVALGCLMARQCHLDTCPVGIATQRPDLRAKFAGTADHVVRYLRLVAAEVREILASLGLRSLDALVGRADLLEPRDHLAARALALDELLAPARHTPPVDAADDPALMPAGAFTLNGRIAARARRGLGHHPIEIRESIRNTDRSVGATLNGLIAARFGNVGVPHAPVRLVLAGSAGQSLGAFGVPGVDIHLAGEANDGVGKGLHGGTIAIAPPPRDPPLPDQVLVGNAALYGATGGCLFVAGRAGERFAVRNSGAVAVVEGVGHHACEYMTGGLVVVLGPTGFNFGAGMTGGLAFVWDPDNRLEVRASRDVVRLGGLDPEDDVAVRSWVAEHQAQTASPLAALLLAQWERVRSAFRKVAPAARAAAPPCAAEFRPLLRA